MTDSRRVTELVDHLAIVAKKSGFSGLLFMVDELGKIFEYAARMPQNTDVFLLQELAEHASRSGGFPLLFLGFLHQSFEQYGQHVDSLTRKEWGKIHGRFEDVAFLEPIDQVIRMVAEAIEWKGKPLSPDRISQIRKVAKACSRDGICPPGMRQSEFEEICLKTFPLHPMTLVALPVIFRRFGQNERSLFSYLSSLEPKGFQDFLKTHSVTGASLSFLRLNHVFDYFVLNFGSGLFRQPHARRWLEAADVLDRRQDLTAVDADLIKTIGVLGALGEFSHLSATNVIISISLDDNGSGTPKFKKAIQSLLDQSILTYRRFNGTYRIWEGSDVDVDERVAEGERQLRGRVGLADNIQRYLPPRPLVARRHNFLTGSLRYFSVGYIDTPEDISSSITLTEGAAGQLLVCLSSSPSILQQFIIIARSTQFDKQNVVFAIPQQIGEIQSAVSELAALRWAWENTPDLRDDRVARREINLRITEAEFFIQQALGVLLDPRAEPLGSKCLWYWRGVKHDVQRPADVTQLLSKICDKEYSKTPWIRNELIVRRKLSSAAAAARRNLIECMNNASDQPALGMDLYPPERSMYESVLRDTGLNSQDANGVWRFTDPSNKKNGLLPVWKYLSEIIFDSSGEPISLHILSRMLSEPPYGVMDGLHPALVCAFMLAHSNEVTLYRDGVFIQTPSMADFEILMKRPEYFAIAGCRVSGGRARIVKRLAKALEVDPETVPVVRQLFATVKRLPDIAWHTKKLSEPTLRLRSAFEKAKVPDKFLYADVPKALGFEPFKETGISKKDLEVFFRVLNRSLQELDGIASKVFFEAKQELLKSCGLDETEAGWQYLREVAARLESRISDPSIHLFLRRVLESSGDEDGVSSVLSLVANRPLNSWTDKDIERFPGLCKGVGEPIRRAMIHAGLRSDSNFILESLTPKQSKEAIKLADSFIDHLTRKEKMLQNGVVRAAFLLLAERFSEKNKDQK